MAETIYRGPAISIGSLMGNVTTAAGLQVGAIDPTDGPGIEYQANTFPDPRFGPFNKDSLKIGRIPVWLNNPYVVFVDTTPMAASTSALAAAQAPTAATPLTLTSVDLGGVGTTSTPSIAHAIPFLPMAAANGNSFPNTGAVVTVLALDFGFTAGNTNGTPTVTVPDSTLFYQGQWIVIGGAGNAGKTLPLICQVLTIPTATTITVSPTPASTLANSPIGSANVYPPTIGAITPNSVQPYVSAGVAAVLNPLEALARNVSITGNAGATAQNVTVRGYDVYGMPMSEVIAFAGGATTAFGKKTFKYIASITPATTDGGHTLAAGVADTMGFHLRSDRWEYANIFYNGSFVTTSAGWLTADKTTPATGSTGDVRGTVQLSSGGAGGTGTAIAGGTITTGALRLTIMMSVPLWNLINGTPVSATSLTGVTQA